MSQIPHALESHMTRRQFTKLAAGGLAAFSLADCHAPGAIASRPPADATLTYAGATSATVGLAGVARGSAAEATEYALRAAALAVSDFSWLSRGDSVLIKPVCNSGNPYPATTDPVALRAMIGLLRERGAGRVLVADMSGVETLRFSKDRLRGSTRQLMHQNRMAPVVEAAGGEVHAFEEHGWDAFFEDTPAAAGSWSQPIMMPKLLNEVDHVVLMPRCARHLLAGSTLGMKAAVGWWRHDSRLEYHRDAATLAEKTADSNTVPSLTKKLRLVLTSATQVLTTFGPDQGYVAAPTTGLILASPSLVAHDMISLAWLLENRSLMPAADRDGVLKDPNTSALFINIANRVVVNWLGGIGDVLSTQRLERYDHQSIWDDRVLRRAFLNSGGVPRIELISEGGSVPPEIQDKLRADVTLTA